MFFDFIKEKKLVPFNDDDPVKKEKTLMVLIIISMLCNVFVQV